MTSLNTILHEYRINADPRLQDEAQKFRALSAQDQRELLFWMAMNAGAAVNNLTVTLLQLANPKGTTAMTANDFIDAVQARAKELDEAIAAIINSEDKEDLEERLRAGGIPGLPWYRKLCMEIIAAIERKRKGTPQ